jgi:hypothetical protein
VKWGLSGTTRRRIAFAIAIVAALAVYSTLTSRWPKDQVLHIVLGDAAPRVEEVRVRYAENAKGSGENGRSGEDWTREASFRYALNSAPRVVTHEPRLPDGDYVLEIDLVSPKGVATVRRKIALQGGTTSIDVSGEVAP